MLSELCFLLEFDILSFHPDLHGNVTLWVNENEQLIFIYEWMLYYDDYFVSDEQNCIFCYFEWVQSCHKNSAWLMFQVRLLCKNENTTFQLTLKITVLYHPCFLFSSNYRCTKYDTFPCLWIVQPIHKLLET